MATTFKTKIEDLIGSVGDDDLIKDSLMHIGSAIIAAAPEDKLNNISLEVAIPDEADSSTPSIGISVDTKRVLGASKGGYRARAVNSEEKTRYLDTDSIYRASDTTPVYYFKDEKVFLIASNGVETGGTLRFVPKIPVADANLTQLDETDDEVYAFPREANSLLMLGAASRCLQRILSDKSNSLPNNIVSPVLRDISTALPTYVSPSALVLTPPPVGADVDFSSVPSAPTYNKPVLTLTTITEPDDLVISASLPSIPVINNVSVSFNATPPSYVKPVIALGSIPTVSWVFPDQPSLPILTNVDVSFTATPPSYTKPVVTVDSLPTVTWTFPDQPVLPVLVNTDVSFTQDAPTYTRPVLATTAPITLSSFPLTDASDWVMPDDVIAPVTTAQTVADITAEKPTFTPPVMGSLDYGATSGTEFWITTEEDAEMLNARVAEIGVKLQEYQSKLSEAQAVFNKESVIYQAVLQDALQEAQLSDSEENRKLQKYGTELQNYQSKVNTVITANQGRIAAWQTEMTLDLEKFNADSGVTLQAYQADMQNELNVFNKESAEYQAELQISIQNAQFDNEAEANKLQVFSAALQRYQAKVQEIITGNQAQIASWESEQGLKLQKNQSDLQNALNVFNKESAVYQAELQVAIQNAQYDNETEANKLQTFSADLQKYQAKVQEVITGNQAEITVWESEQGLKLQKNQSDVQNALNEFNKESAVYQAELQISIQDSQLSAGTEANKLQIFASELQKYQADVNQQVEKYTLNEVQKQVGIWTTRVQNELAEYSANIQNESARVGNDMGIYQQEIQKALQKYQSETGYDLQKYQAVVAADVQKFQMDLQDNTSDFTNSLTKYTTELGEITQSNQSVLALYGADVQNYSAKMQKEITDYQWKQGQYSALYQDYVQGLQIFSGSSDNVGNPEQLTRR